VQAGDKRLEGTLVGYRHVVVGLALGLGEVVQEEGAGGGAAAADGDANAAIVTRHGPLCKRAIDNVAQERLAVVRSVSIGLIVVGGLGGNKELRDDAWQRMVPAYEHLPDETQGVLLITHVEEVAHDGHERTLGPRRFLGERSLQGARQLWAR